MAEKKILILGLGNDLLCDDGIGIQVVRTLEHENIPTTTWFEIHYEQSATGGIRLLDLIEGYHWVIIVDSLITEKKKLGSLHCIDLSAVSDTSPRASTLSAHTLSVIEVINVGKHLSREMPQRINIIGIEVVDTRSVTQKLSPSLERLFPCIIDKVRAYIQYLLGEKDEAVEEA